MTTATYLYCVVRAGKKPSASGVPAGVPEATQPDILAVGPSLWLVAADVPLEVYGPGKLEPLLGDLSRVAEIAVAHESVVEHFARRPDLTVVPMKLFTMFSTHERALADIARRTASLLETIKRIDGSEEWGVRIMRSSAAGARSSSERPASGAAFLAAKKKAKDDIRDAKIAAAEAALSAFDSLAAIARESRRREDPPAGGATPPLLDAVFLVKLGARGRFTDAAQRESAACERAGAHLALTGPWPAYNFVEEDGTR